MVRRTLAVLGTLALVVGGLLLIPGSSDVAAAGKKPVKKPLAKFPHDPEAAEVDLFEGMEAGQLAVQLIHQNSMVGNVLIQNLTDKPLNVKLPQAAVGVPKHLAQFGGGGGFGGGGLGGGGLGGGGLGGGGLGGGGGFMGGGAGGFGSIPPEAIATVPFHSVCLEHGKPEPTVKSNYTLVPVTRFSDDPALRELLEMVGTGRVDPQAAQAAAWHLTDNLSFEQLAAKSVTSLAGTPPTPYFTRQQLLGASSLLHAAQRRAEDEGPTPVEPSPRGEDVRAERTTASPR